MSSGSSITADTTMSGLTTDTRTTSAGRGRGGGRGRGRGHARRGTPRPRSTSFRGTTTTKMGGNVFECYEEQSDRRQYTKTVEALQGHVKKTMKNPEDLASLFATVCRMPVLIRPPRPVAAPPAPTGDGDTAAADTEDIKAEIDEIWKEDLRALSKRKSVLRGNLSAIHAVIWGQCSEATKTKLKSLYEFPASAEQDNCEWFLRTINAIIMQFDAKHNGYLAMLDATANFLNCRQQQSQTVSNYMDTFKSHVDTIEYHGGTVVLNQNLAPGRAPDGRPLSQAEQTKIARDSTLAVALLRGADKTRFGTLITSLDNQFSNGRDKYPADLTSAYGLLVSYNTPTNATWQVRVSHYNNEEASVGTQATTTTAEITALAFAQRSASVTGSNGVLHEGVTYYRWNNTGHYACDCPNEPSTDGSVGTTLLQHGVMLAQGETTIDPSWVLLDSQSTISVFRNCDMVLKKIRHSARALRAVTNGGSQESKLLGDFPNLGEVWFNPDSIANILSLSAVRKICRVTMDTTAETAMIVHCLDGS